MTREAATARSSCRPLEQCLSEIRSPTRSRRTIRMRTRWPSRARGRGPWTVRVAPAPSSACADDAPAAWGSSTICQQSVGPPGDPIISSESAAVGPERLRPRVPSGACAREVQRPSPAGSRRPIAVGTDGSRDAVSRSEPYRRAVTAHEDRREARCRGGFVATARAVALAGAWLFSARM